MLWKESPPWQNPLLDYRLGTAECPPQYVYQVTAANFPYLGVHGMLPSVLVTPVDPARSKVEIRYSYVDSVNALIELASHRGKDGSYHRWSRKACNSTQVCNISGCHDVSSLLVFPVTTTFFAVGESTTWTQT